MFLNFGRFCLFVLAKNAERPSISRGEFEIAYQDNCHSCRAVFSGVSKVICVCFGFALPCRVCDWLARFAPLYKPMRRVKTKNNRASLARVFPRLIPVKSNSDWSILLFMSIVIGQSRDLMAMISFSDNRFKTILILLFHAKPS